MGKHSYLSFLLVLSAAGPALAEPPENLLKLFESQRTTEHEPIKPYDRRAQFGGWIHPAKSCLTTRDLVLLRDRDPRSAVDFTDRSRCQIAAAEWKDPYTGDTFSDPKDIQIDHVVPLAAAYRAGADKWTPARRCNYANFMGNRFHLIAVSGHENMLKSDKGPDEYLPPNTAFQCKYVAAWVRVKAIWNLVMPRSELKAIERVFSDQHCDPKLMTIAKEELAKERVLTLRPIAACANFTKG